MATIGSVVWGVRDIPRAIEFWAAAIDPELRDPPEDDWAVLLPHAGQEGLQLSLKLTESDAPHRTAPHRTAPHRTGTISTCSATTMPPTSNGSSNSGPTPSTTGSTKTTPSTSC